jgi:hypothetical protein
LKQWLQVRAAIFGNKKIEELEMNASVYCTSRTPQQTEAIVADLKRAGFAEPSLSPLTDADRSSFDTHSFDTSSYGGMRICVHVANPNQRNAAQDIFFQHDADDITTSNETHATTH